MEETDHIQAVVVSAGMTPDMNVASKPGYQPEDPLAPRSHATAASVPFDAQGKAHRFRELLSSQAIHRNDMEGQTRDSDDQHIGKFDMATSRPCDFTDLGGIRCQVPSDMHLGSGMPTETGMLHARANPFRGKLSSAPVK